MASFQLYHANDSLCSFMARYTIAICEDEGSPTTPMNVNYTIVDITGKKEQLQETFLTKINPKGLVPVLVNLQDGTIIPDSLELTYYLAKWFPDLVPDVHAEKIKSGLQRIHALPYFTLSFGGHPAQHLPMQTMEDMRKLLAQDDLSEEYRKVLQMKLEGASKADIPSKLTPQAVASATVTMKEFFASILPDLEPGKWFFGLEKPSPFDAHLVPLLVRLQDVGRDEIIPELLKAYAVRAKETTAWKRVMAGLTTTMCPG